MEERAQVLELIRSRLSLKQVVERYVALKPAGHGRWKGLCPFHSEDTPSFQVDETKGLFYCFGCKAGGDLFTFIQRIEGLEFSEAVERLAQECGVEVPRGPAGPRRRELLGVLELAHTYFRRQLTGPPRDYLKARGVDEAMVERFGLGYAPSSSEGLLRFLQHQGVRPEEALAAGVLVEHQGRFRDRFYHRIIFPLQDPLGRVVGFTGRALGEQGPKYLNSPETPVFRKSQLLFGYAQARKALQARERAIVVEGLFDVIALHQLGFEESVAVLGSSLSLEQAQLLLRLGVRQLYLAFDADEAGRRATLQSLDLEIARRFLVFAVLLEEGRDPGDLLGEPDGRTHFQRALDQALPEVEYRFQALAQDLDLRRPEGKQKLLERLLPRLLSPEPFDPVVERLKELIVSRLQLDPRALEEFLASRRRSLKAPAPSLPSRPDPRERRTLLELDLIAQILSAPDEELKRWAQFVEDHTWPPEGSFLAEFLKVAKEESSPRRLLAHFERRGEGARLIERLLMIPRSPQQDLASRLEQGMARLREHYLTERYLELKDALKVRQDPALLKEIAELQRAIEAERRLWKR